MIFVKGRLRAAFFVWGAGMSSRAASFIIAGLLATASPVQAADVVKLGWSNALYEAPRARFTTGLVLITGGDGRVGIGADGSVANDRNWIVWTRGAYSKAGIASLLVDQGADISEAVALLRARGAKKVAIVGMSNGSVRALGGLSARPDKLVLVSGKLAEVQARLGSAAALPPTLVIHHRGDGCRGTPPSAVESFAAWAGGKAQVKWTSGGVDEGDPCRPFGHHGHRGVEAQVVSAVIAFAKR